MHQNLELGKDRLSYYYFYNRFLSVLVFFNRTVDSFINSFIKDVRKTFYQGIKVR